MLTSIYEQLPAAKNWVLHWPVGREMPSSFYYVRETSWCWGSCAKRLVACRRSSSSPRSPRTPHMKSAISSGWESVGWPLPARDLSSSYLSTISFLSNSLFLMTLTPFWQPNKKRFFEILGRRCSTVSKQMQCFRIFCLAFLYEWNTRAGLVI